MPGGGRSRSPACDELRGAWQLRWHTRTFRHHLADRWPGGSRTGPGTIGTGNANGGGAAKLKAESRPHRGPGQRRRGSASSMPTTGSRRSLAGAASLVKGANDYRIARRASAAGRLRAPRMILSRKAGEASRPA
jgi:hypothetical protein